MALKLITSVVVSCLVAVATAETVTIGAMGTSPYLDGEISTNVAINVYRSDTKRLVLRLASSSTSTSSLQIAFGRDANGNGDLEPTETALVVGRRGLEYFIEDVASGERYLETGSETDTEGSFIEFDLQTDVDYHPLSVGIRSECGSCFTDLGVQSWMYDSKWNLAKLTRRGVGPILEMCSVENRFRALMMVFR